MSIGLVGLRRPGENVPHDPTWPRCLTMRALGITCARFARPVTRARAPAVHHLYTFRGYR